MAVVRGSGPPKCVHPGQLSCLPCARLTQLRVKSDSESCILYAHTTSVCLASAFSAVLLRASDVLAFFWFLCIGAALVLWAAVLLRAPQAVQPHSLVENFLTTMLAVQVSATQLLREASCWTPRALGALAHDVRQNRTKIAAAAAALVCSVVVFVVALFVPSPSAKTLIVSIATLIAVLTEAAVVFALGDPARQAAAAILSLRIRAVSGLLALLFSAVAIEMLLHSADWSPEELNDSALLLIAGTFCFGASVMHLIRALPLRRRADDHDLPERNQDTAFTAFCKRHVLPVAALAVAFASYVQRTWPEDRRDRCLAMSIQALLLPIALEALTRAFSTDPPELAAVVADILAIATTLGIALAAAILLARFPKADVLLMVSAACLLGPLAGATQLLLRSWRRGHNA